MKLSDIFGSLTGLLTLARAGIAEGRDVAPLITKSIAITTKGEHATQADLDGAQATVDQWHAEVQKPIPPEEE